MPVIPPAILIALTTGLVALIPKAVTDAYDYCFGGEVIQVKKKPDKTKLTPQNKLDAYEAYQVYKQEDSMYKSQKQLVANLNQWFGTNKSVPQMMRVCKGYQEPK